jgi:hypothetical protein
MSVETSKLGVEKERIGRRRRRWRLLSVLAAVNLVAIGLTAGPSQAQSTTCNTVFGGGEITGDLVVPTGSFCQLVDTTVTGNVTVQAGSDLFLDSSWIQGSLSVGTNAFVDAYEARVDGMTSLSGAFGIFASSSRFNRTILNVDSGFVYSKKSTHWGGITSTNGETIIETGVVLGSVRTNGDLKTDIFDSAVFGLVTAENATDGSVICDLGAGFGVTVKTSGGLIQIGNGGPITNCSFNVLGQIQVHNNVASQIDISGNLVAGDLNCSGNSPAPTGSSNFVFGAKIGQCASLVPAPSSMTLMSETTAPRTAHILSLIDARVNG